MTARDREMVRWVGRLRMATAAQVTERFQLGRAVGYARLSGLVRLGLLDHARIVHASPGVYLTTRAGLACVDLALPPPRVDLRTYDHDLQLTALVIELEREFGADPLTTEREMRAADTPVGSGPVERPRFAVPLAGARGQLQLWSRQKSPDSRPRRSSRSGTDPRKCRPTPGGLGDLKKRRRAGRPLSARFTDPSGMKPIFARWLVRLDQ